MTSTVPIFTKITTETHPVYNEILVTIYIDTTKSISEVT
jgi:hypothetical protein